MAIFEAWRDISVGSPSAGFDTVGRYRYNTDDDTIAFDSFVTMTGVLGPIHPAVGTVMYTLCDGLDLNQYKSTGSSSSINKVVTEDAPSCCTLVASDFSVVRTNNTVLLTPNGTITVTAPVVNINEYQASIDGGSTWNTALSDEIVFEDLPAGTYTVIIKAIAGICSVSTSVVIVDAITYPPLIISETSLPALYAPVFYPITVGFTLDNNTATVKNDGATYLQAGSTDAAEYLSTLPIIKILDNEDYAGTWQITGVDDPLTPTKFYFDGAYTSDQVIAFVPFDKQVFQLFCESAANVFSKIADINIYPDSSGVYNLRVEGFLQAAFKIMPPVNDGDEITLLRKYYVVARDFDMSASPTILNAVYSAVPVLTSFLGDVIPLGPAPINFINEISSFGYPVLFSFIDLTTGRIRNITSSEITTIVATTPIINVNALSMNSYDVTWVNPAGSIGSLNVTPPLPDWITLESSPPDTVKLHIDTDVVGVEGDYDGSDYNDDDYLVSGANAIIGCYTFEFRDVTTPLFTLNLCIFPIQSATGTCKGGYNIAWINREGGWSSYIFEGKKTHGTQIGEVRTYKKGNELRRLSVEDVYDAVEVNIAGKGIRDMQFISSLRKSIQAYLWSEQTLSWSIPIILENASYKNYSTPFRQIEVVERFTFKYAIEEVIQSQ